MIIMYMSQFLLVLQDISSVRTTTSFQLIKMKTVKTMKYNLKARNLPRYCHSEITAALLSRNVCCATLGLLKYWRRKAQLIARTATFRGGQNKQLLSYNSVLLAGSIFPGPQNKICSGGFSGVVLSELLNGYGSLDTVVFCIGISHCYLNLFCGYSMRSCRIKLASWTQSSEIYRQVT
jgi:hypothetical protein